MAARKPPGRPGAEVDYVVDENASPVDVEDGSLLVPSDDIEESIGATAPASWWPIGLIALLVVAGILLALQLFGGDPGTAVVPGTPVSAPAGPPSLSY